MNLNNLVKKDNKEDEEKQFNLKVFDNEIVYSTNSNFEFVYLFSLQSLFFSMGLFLP